MRCNLHRRSKVYVISIIIKIKRAFANVLIQIKRNPIIVAKFPSRELDSTRIRETHIA